MLLYTYIVLCNSVFSPCCFFTIVVSLPLLFLYHCCFFTIVSTAGSQNKSWEIPCSGTGLITHLPTTSNVGRPGVWVFRIDQEDITPAFPPDGNTMKLICMAYT